MANFKKAFGFVIGNEGGYANHPADRGGPTNWGITIATLSRWLKRPASISDVKKLSRATAEKIYKARYWDVLGLDKALSDIAATAIFDQGVNRGVTTVCMNVQKILGVDADGHFGSKSMAALNKMPELIFLDRLADNAQANYNAIVKRNPSQKIFIKGWTNRVKHLRALAKWA